MHEHVEPFIAARSYAPTSARQRRHILNRYCGHGDPTVAHAYEWWASIAHLAPASRRAHLGAVRAFISHLILVGVIKSDPTASIVAPKEQQAPPVVLSPVEVARLLVHVETPRDRVVVALMLGCGLRGGDVARLDVDDVDLDARIIRVTGKGRKVRLVPVPRLVADLLADHIDGMGDGPLIRCPDGHRLTPEQLRYRVTRELYRAGVKHGPLDGRSSHVLRRTCATTLLEHGHATLVDVAAILGHSELSSTQRYLALPDAKRLLDIIETGPMAA